MPVYRYSIIPKNTNRQYPRFDKSKNILYLKIDKVYKYYAEAKEVNDKYYLLFSNEKFDDNCKTCNIDSYGRYRLRLSNVFRDMLNNILDIDCNIKLTYVETIDSYDVFELGSDIDY